MMICFSVFWQAWSPALRVVSCVLFPTGWQFWWYLLLWWHQIIPKFEQLNFKRMSPGRPPSRITKTSLGLKVGAPSGLLEKRAFLGCNEFIVNLNDKWTSINLTICSLITQQHSTASEPYHLSMGAGVLLVGLLPRMPSCCQRNAPARRCWKAPLLDAKFSSRQGISLMMWFSWWVQT